MSCLIAVHCFTCIVNFYVQIVHFLGFRSVFADQGAMIGLDFALFGTSRCVSRSGIASSAGLTSLTFVDLIP